MTCLFGKKELALEEKQKQEELEAQVLTLLAKLDAVEAENAKLIAKLKQAEAENDDLRKPPSLRQAVVSKVRAFSKEGKSAIAAKNSTVAAAH
jgi:uncharacterized protein YhaN